MLPEQRHHYDEIWGGTCSGLTVAADPESGYTAIEVQVVYTYKPYFPLYSIENVHLGRCRRPRLRRWRI